MACTGTGQGKPGHWLFWIFRSSLQSRGRAVLIQAGPGFPTHVASTAHRRPWIFCIFIFSEIHNNSFIMLFFKFENDSYYLWRNPTTTEGVDITPSTWHIDSGRSRPSPPPRVFLCLPLTLPLSFLLRCKNTKVSFHQKGFSAWPGLFNIDCQPSWMLPA